MTKGFNPQSIYISKSILRRNEIISKVLKTYEFYFKSKHKIEKKLFFFFKKDNTLSDYTTTKSDLRKNKCRLPLEQP